MAGRYRGAIHHRWIFTVQEGTLLAVPKLPYLEQDDSFQELEALGLNQSLVDLMLLWQDTLPMRILNDGFMGPSGDAVVRMVRDALSPAQPDDVDAAVTSRLVLAARGSKA
ncbi:unnamed protein product [Effrenium voratum]|nr:unnamed protein product [Effrenium voratum]